MVAGFAFAGVRAGIKKNGDLDLGLLVADEPAVCAALFTRNIVRAHPVTLSEQRLAEAGWRTRALLVNSGNANACNGDAGRAAALETSRAISLALDVDPALVLPSSTGVIGQPLPTSAILGGVDALLEALRKPEARQQQGVEEFAQAICTTDRWIKIARAQVPTENGNTAEILAIGKGAGMYHPDLGRPGELPGDELSAPELHATMLVYAVTDAALSQEDLMMALDEAADRTFNASSVDGDTSTNDSVYCLASGRAGPVESRDLQMGLEEAFRSLCRSMVLDGEGAEHVVDIHVRGLASDAEARDVARTIATSPLVKTALFGKDANWGRLLAAAGRSGVLFDPTKAAIYVAGVCICENGGPTTAAADEEASRRMRDQQYVIEVVLGGGPGAFTYYTSDLGHGYVDVNAGYRS